VLRIVGVVVAGLAAFFGLLILLSPVDPVAWDAPDAKETAAMCGKTAPRLTAQVLAKDLPGTPDGIDIGPDGQLYAALSSGDIARIDPISGRWEIVGSAPGARLTGLAATPGGMVYAVDEAGGPLYAFDLKGPIPAPGRVVLAEAGGRKLQWTNDVADGPDGLLYLTTSSRRRTLDQFFFEVLEHRGSGQLIRFDPKSGSVKVLADTLEMTNGLAVAADGKLLVSQSAIYAVTVIDPESGAPGASAGNLPGFTGNVRMSDRAHIAWVTLLSPRSGLIDGLAQTPWVRRLLAWAPSGVRPQPQPINCVIALVSDIADLKPRGYVVASSGVLPSFSTALEHRGRLYLTPAGIAGPNHRAVYVSTVR
jgi:strictosidine synthase